MRLFCIQRTLGVRSCQLRPEGRPLSQPTLERQEVRHIRTRATPERLRCWSLLKHCCSRYGDDGDDCYRYGEDDYDYEDDFNPVQDEEANYLFASHFASQEQSSEGRGGGGLISSLCSGGDVAKGGNISIDGTEGSLGDRKPVGKKRRRRLLPRRMQRSSNLLLVGGPAE